MLPDELHCVLAEAGLTLSTATKVKKYQQLFAHLVNYLGVTSSGLRRRKYIAELLMNITEYPTQYI